MFGPGETVNESCRIGDEFAKLLFTTAVRYCSVSFEEDVLNITIGTHLLLLKVLALVFHFLFFNTGP